MDVKSGQLRKKIGFFFFLYPQVLSAIKLQAGCCREMIVGDRFDTTDFWITLLLAVSRQQKVAPQALTLRIKCLCVDNHKRGQTRKRFIVAVWPRCLWTASWFQQKQRTKNKHMNNTKDKIGITSDITYQMFASSLLRWLILRERVRVCVERVCVTFQRCLRVRVHVLKQTLVLVFAWSNSQLKEYLLVSKYLHSRVSETLMDSHCQD